MVTKSHINLHNHNTKPTQTIIATTTSFNLVCSFLGIKEGWSLPLGWFLSIKKANKKLKDMWKYVLIVRS